MADPAAAASEDIAGGQAHRARLTAARESGQLRNYGDDYPLTGRRHTPLERPLHPNRNIGNGNYVHGASTASNGYLRTTSSSTPRGLQSPPIPTNSSGGRAVPPLPDGHVRPPSPRSQGTVWFGAGGRRTERPSTALLKGQAQPTAARPVLPSPSAVMRTTAPTATFPRNRSAATSVPSRPTATPTLAASCSATSSTSVPLRATHNSTTSQASGNALGPGDPEMWTHCKPPDYIRLGVLQNQALLHAGNPGADADKFAHSGPEAARYLEEARRRLINEVTRLAKRKDRKEMDDYVKAHQERRWMVFAAVKARELLEYASDTEVRAYYDGNEGHRAFFETAMVLHGLQRTMPVKPPSPSTSQTTVSATAPPSTHSTSIVVPTAASQVASPDPSTRTTANPFKARPLSASAATITTSSPTTATRISTSSASTVRTQRPTLNANMSTTVASTAVPAVQTAPAVPTAPATRIATQTQAPTTTVSNAHPNGSVSTASSRSSLRSAATDVTIPPRRGVMNIIYIDSNDKFVGYEHVEVEDPVNASVTINSTDASFDPRGFFARLMAVAQGMDANSVNRSHGLEGAVQADDGVWQGGEEL